jgi:F-type H+-transporting ATPase subunit b
MSALTTLMAAPAHAEGGLVLIPEAPLLGVLVVGFSLLVIPMNALIFKPIFRALDEREQRIAGARRRATALQRTADEILDRYQTQVRDVRADAEVSRKAKLSEAREEHAEMTAAARTEAEQTLERTRAELAQSVEAARSSLRGQAQQLAQGAAERILGRPL